MEAIEVGKEYDVSLPRSGWFRIRIDGVDEPAIVGTITKGTLKRISGTNKGPGDKVLLWTDCFWVKFTLVG